MQKKFLTALFVLSAIAGYAQWERLGGPFGAHIYDLFKSDESLFARTGHSFYEFHPEAHKWKKIESPLYRDFYSIMIAKKQEVLLNVYSTGNGFADDFKLLQSADNGVSWTEINMPQDSSIEALISCEFGFYLQGNEHIYYSVDDGASWQISSIDSVYAGVGDLYEFDGHAYHTYYKFLHRAAHGEEVWTTVEFPGNEPLYEFYAFDSLYFAVGWITGHLYRSGDAGLTWDPPHPRNWDHSRFVQVGEYYYGYVEDRIYRSMDNGISFNSIGQSPKTFITDLGSLKDSLVIGTHNEIIITHPQFLHAEKYFDNGMDAAWVNSIYLTDQLIWMGIDNKGIMTMDPVDGSQNRLIHQHDNVRDVIVTPSRIFAARGDDYLYFSTDKGATWSTITHPHMSGFQLRQFYEDSLSIYVTGLNDDRNAMFKRDKAPISPWGLFVIEEIDPNTSPKAMHQVGNLSYAIYERKIARKNGEGPWEIIREENQVNKVIDKFITGEKIIGYLKDSSGPPFYTLFLSVDHGETWYKANTDSIFTGHNILGFLKVIIIDTVIVAYSGHQFETMYISYDQGNSWQPFNEGLNSGYIDELRADDQYIYASTYGQSVYRRKISDIITSTYFASETSYALKIFPNPTSGDFSVSFPTLFHQKGDLLIYGLDGKLIYHKVYENTNRVSLQLTNIVNGLYVVVLRSGSRSIYSKLVFIQ